MRSILAAGVVGILSAAAAGSASAHPHVFVDAKVELVFDKDGKVLSVRNIWQFDKPFTAYAVQGLDTNHDGKISDAELKPLAKTNVEALEEYKYFTFLKIGGKLVAFDPPKEYFLQFVSGRLTLFYTLPLKTPAAPTGGVTLDIFDPEYFVAITFVEKEPFKLVDAPAACHSTFQKPHELNPSDAAILSAIPADQHDLPSGLTRVALGLANTFKVSCP